MEIVKWLEEWYRSNCNGEWEQEYGIEIGTLDNPGWYVKINLFDVSSSFSPMQEQGYDHGDNDWIKCSILNNVFEGYGDCLKLEMILHTFKNWISA